MPELQIALTGTDGSTWDLVHGPIKLSTSGIIGLGMPDPDDQVTQTVLGDGQILTGWRLKPRKVMLPIQFKGASAGDPIGLQRAWWKAWAIGQFATLTVTDGNGGVRSIKVRFQDDGGWTQKLDPYISVTIPVPMTLIADSPWWEGPPAVTTFAADPNGARNFYGGGPVSANGSAAPYYISRVSGSASYNVANLGDAPAWPEWVISGGTSTAFRVGVNGQYLASSMALGPTDVLDMLTDPLVQVLTVNGAKVPFRNFTSLDFAPIPLGATVPLTIDITGTATVTATFKPRYARAY